MWAYGAVARCAWAFDGQLRRLDAAVNEPCAERVPLNPHTAASRTRARIAHDRPLEELRGGAQTLQVLGHLFRTRLQTLHALTRQPGTVDTTRVGERPRPVETLTHHRGALQSSGSLRSRQCRAEPRHRRAARETTWACWRQREQNAIVFKHVRPTLAPQGLQGRSQANLPSVKTAVGCPIVLQALARALKPTEPPVTTYYILRAHEEASSSSRAWATDRLDARTTHT